MAKKLQHSTTYGLVSCLSFKSPLADTYMYYIFFSANCISRLQLLNLSIIRSIKMQCRKDLVVINIISLEKKKVIQENLDSRYNAYGFISE